MAPDEADTVVLVVSELLTNALRHGGGRCRACAPLTRTAAPGGFGWPMVTRFAHATAVTRRASGGKTVSVCLAR